MARKSLNSTRDASEPKYQTRRLTITDKLQILDMTKEGKSLADVARHFGVSVYTVRNIKRNEASIRKTAETEANISETSSSHTCAIKEEPIDYDYGPHEEPVTPLTCGNIADNLSNAVMNYESSVSKHAGCTTDQLELILTFSKQIKEFSQKWDDDKIRSENFCKKINEVVDPYKSLYDWKVMQLLQPPITTFFQPLSKKPMDDEESTLAIKKEEI